MPQRTIYVKEEHQKLWEEAKELVGDDSLSEIVAEGLQRVIDARKNIHRGFERIELELEGYSIAFQGREIAHGAYDEHNEDTYLDNEHWAYVTPKRNILIYTLYGQLGDRERLYKVFQSVNEAKAEVDENRNLLYPPAFLNEIAEEMGEDYIHELDI